MKNPHKTDTRKSLKSHKPSKSQYKKACKNSSTHRAFALLEVVFAVLILGVAFGILARFYHTRAQSQEAQNITQNLEQIQQQEEKIIAELESQISPKSHKIIGTNGEFCEGKMFEKSAFKLFKPQNCEQ